jgi:SAM-dependent methyltransferase
MDISEHNRAAWNRQSREGSEWTTPVGPREIREARRGVWSVRLTPTKSVPRDWFGEVRERRILCLASGGGQQAPVLAAAGAAVVSLDLSDEQLARDREVAEREGIDLQLIQGSMGNLQLLADVSFDLIFNPVSTVFIPEIRPLWRECFRVLKPGGALLTGFMNPFFFLFDHDEAERTGALVARHSLPYAESTADDLSPGRREAIQSGEALEFSHSLDAQIGGQLEAGFLLVGFYEDWWTDDATPLNRLCPTSMATRALRPT